VRPGQGAHLLEVEDGDDGVVEADLKAKKVRV